MPHRPYHHGDLRAALLVGAEQALKEKGPDALSLREITRGIGVSHTASGRHFKDKRALFDALAADGYARLTGALEAADDAGLPFPQRITALNRAYLRFATENTALLELMFTRKHSADADEGLTVAVERSMAFMRGVITEAQRRGEVIGGDPDQVTLLPAAALHGVAAFVANGTLTPQGALDQLDQLVHNLLYGLTPR